MEIPKTDIGKHDSYNEKYHIRKSNHYFKRYLNSNKSEHLDRYNYHWQLSDFYFKKQRETYAKWREARKITHPLEFVNSLS
ncbi:MAG: hypothetical protein RLZZ628_3729 [Bacteroidota bacterium]|jgi:hypothetical protein